MPDLFTASNATATPVATATPASPAPSATGGAPITNGSEASTQGAPSDTFLSSDPNTLPPDLKTAYDNMLRDYKRKTTDISERSKEVEANKEKIEAYTTLMADERFMKFWKSLDAPQEPVANGELLTDEEWQAALIDKTAFVSAMHKLASTQSEPIKKELNEAKHQIEVRNASDVIGAFAEASDKEGKRLHPMFDEFHELGLMDFFLSKNPPRNSKEYSTKLSVAYENAQKLHQSIYEKGKNDGLGRVEAKASISSEPASSTITTPAMPIDPRNVTAKQAVDFARKGIVIKED